jgi:hypothetical protein
MVVAGAVVRGDVLAVKERIRIGGRSARIQSAVHQAVKKLGAATCRDELAVPQIAAEAAAST